MKRFVVVLLAVGAMILGLVPQAHAGGPFSGGIYDDFFNPDPVTPTIGQSVTWHNFGAVTHTATMIGPYKLFDTGNIPPGNNGLGVVNYAGTFPYECSIHLFKGTYAVADVVTPSTGPASTLFDVEWASNAPPPKNVFHVMEAVGGGAWTNLYKGKSGGFPVQFVSGTIHLRSRLESRLHPKKKHSGWSPTRDVVVT